MMVTGDHPATATTIARWVNIVTNEKVLNVTKENARKIVDEDTTVPKDTLVAIDVIDDSSEKDEEERHKRKSKSISDNNLTSGSANNLCFRALPA